MGPLIEQLRVVLHIACSISWLAIPRRAKRREEYTHETWLIHPCLGGQFSWCGCSGFRVWIMKWVLSFLPSHLTRTGVQRIISWVLVFQGKKNVGFIQRGCDLYDFSTCLRVFGLAFRRSVTRSRVEGYCIRDGNLYMVVLSIWDNTIRTVWWICCFFLWCWGFSPHLLLYPTCATSVQLYVYNLISYSVKIFAISMLLEIYWLWAPS